MILKIMLGIIFSLSSLNAMDMARDFNNELISVSEFYRDSIVKPPPDVIIPKLDDIANNFSDEYDKTVVRFAMAEVYLKYIIDSGSPGNLNQKIKQDYINKAYSGYDMITRTSSYDFWKDQSLYRMGEIEYNRKNILNATKLFENVSSRVSNYFVGGEAMLAMVYSNMVSGDYKKAEEVFNKFLNKYPRYTNDKNVIFLNGYFAFRNGKFNIAEDNFTKLASQESMLYLGYSYFFDGKYQLAAATFDKIGKDYPTAPYREKNDFLIGECFFKMNNYDTAIMKYKAFIDAYPDSQYKPTAMFRIGLCLLKQNDFRGAEFYFTHITSYYPDKDIALFSSYFLARSYEMEKRFAEAIDTYKSITARKDVSQDLLSLSYFGLARTYYMLKDYTGAINICDKFISLFPANKLRMQMDLMLANSLANKGDEKQALMIFKNVIIDMSLPPSERDDVIISVLDKLSESRQYSSILSLYNLVIKSYISDKDINNYINLMYVADAYLFTELPHKSQLIYEKIVSECKDEKIIVPAMDGLAWSYFYQGNIDKALDLRYQIQRMLDAMPGTHSFYYKNNLSIADIMFYQKRYDEAYKLYESFVKKSYDDLLVPKAMFLEGLCLYRLKYYSDALDVWENLFKKYPDNEYSQKAVFNMADTYFRTGDYSKAIDYYKEIISMGRNDADQPLYYLRLSQLYYSMQNYVDSLETISLLISKFPDSAEATTALDLAEAIYDKNPKINYKLSLKQLANEGSKSKVSADAQFRLARRLYEEEKYDDAIAEFKNFIAAYTSSNLAGQAQFYLGMSYYKIKDFKNAVAVLKPYTDNYVTSEEYLTALFTLASSQFKLKLYKESLESYKIIVDKYPDSTYYNFSLFNLAMTYRILGDVDKAKESLWKFYEVSTDKKGSDVISALWEIFNIEKEQANYENALKVLDTLQTSLAQSEDIFEVLYRKADLLISMKKQDEAVKIYKEIIAMEPKKNPYRLQALIKLGEIYENQKMYKAAAELYDDLAANSSGDVKKAAKERAVQLKDISSGNSKTN